MTCTHPDHNENENCLERAIGCHPQCGCCMESPEKSAVRMNAEKDPAYRPYCLRCSGVVRMDIVEPFLWNHKCGAIHDERV